MLSRPGVRTTSPSDLSLEDGASAAGARAGAPRQQAGCMDWSCTGPAFAHARKKRRPGRRDAAFGLSRPQGGGGSLRNRFEDRRHPREEEGMPPTSHSGPREEEGPPIVGEDAAVAGRRRPPPHFTTPDPREEETGPSRLHGPFGPIWRGGTREEEGAAADFRGPREEEDPRK